MELIGTIIVAIIDGLALDHELACETRVAFDVFWRAILSRGN